VLEAALFGHDRVPGDALGGAGDGAALEIEQLYALRRQHGHFAVAEKENAARVREDRRNVAGDKKLVLAQADDDGRPEARGDDLVGVLGGDGHERVRAAHHLDGFEHRFFERRVLGKLFKQMGDDFRVGFGEELMALGDELLF